MVDIFVSFFIGIMCCISIKLSGAPFWASFAIGVHFFLMTLIVFILNNISETIDSNG